MAFDYDKLKKKEEHMNYWTSYSDLMTMMSTVFLLLYVVASLRTGTTTLQQNIQYQKVTEQNEDLKQQLKVYSLLKDHYLQTQATSDQMKAYKKLMAHLDLLKDQANQEKNELEQKAQENADKEQALNQYQQMVRNIINSNIMAKAKIDQSAEKVAALTSSYNDASQNLKKVKSQLIVTQGQLAKEGEQNKVLVTQLTHVQKKYKGELSTLRKDYYAQVNRERKAFDKKLANERMSAKAREHAIAAFRAKMKKEKGQMEAQMADLNGKMKASQGELKKAEARLNAQRELANRIAGNFKRAGVNAQVNPETGDVILSFGDEYFDTGKSKLKPRMESILKKSIPIYAKSLFQDKKVAKKLAAVEIVGFASPTYKGKFVDPQSMNESTKQAVNYNLDLSYYRARNIFNYIFDQSKMHYANQRRLRTLVKVTGRSYLAEKIDDGGRSIASGESYKNFCKHYDCKKAQRVIIKFDLKN